MWFLTEDGGGTAYILALVMGCRVDCETTSGKEKQWKTRDDTTHKQEEDKERSQDCVAASFINRINSTQMSVVILVSPR